jgi:hypothetical protein
MTTTTEQFTPPRAVYPQDPWSDASRKGRPTASTNLTFSEMLTQIGSLISVVFVAGPPVVFLGGVWLFFGLMLVGPFAVVVALAIVFVAAAALVGLIAAILASPYLLVRHFRGHRAARAPKPAPAPAPAAQLVVVEAPGAAA